MSRRAIVVRDRTDRAWVTISLGRKGWRAHYSRFDRHHHTTYAVTTPTVEWLAAEKREGASGGATLLSLLGQVDFWWEEDGSTERRDNAHFFAGMLHALWDERMPRGDLEAIIRDLVT